MGLLDEYNSAALLHWVLLPSRGGVKVNSESAADDVIEVNYFECLLLYG